MESESYFCKSNCNILMKRSVVVVAGGSGTRMGSKLPKQFILLENRPVLLWSISCFVQFDPDISIVVVLPEDQINYWNQLCQEYNFKPVHQVVKGGETRFQSVKNGLSALGNTELIAVHDGVRPLVSRDTIDSCFSEASRSGAAIPVLPVNETIRTGTYQHSTTVDRSLFFTVQTPQVFRASLLLEAYGQPGYGNFTDDASVVEKFGHPVIMVPGNLENIKITHPGDLLLVSEYLKKKKDIR